MVRPWPARAICENLYDAQAVTIYGLNLHLLHNQTSRLSAYLKVNTAPYLLTSLLVMDDARTFALFICNLVFASGVSLVLFGPMRAARAETEYIDPARIAELNTQFETALPVTQLKTLERAWSCDLLGVASKLSAEHNVSLYNFRRSTPRALRNSGVGPVSTFELIGPTLEGHGPKGHREQLRLLVDGRLISKLSSPVTEITIAFAICSGT